MPKESSHFDKSETSLKFPLGPIMSPNPGPTLEIDVAAPDIADKKSSPVIDSKVDKRINKKRYEKIKIITELIKLSVIF